MVLFDSRVERTDRIMHKVRYWTQGVYHFSNFKEVCTWFGNFCQNHKFSKCHKNITSKALENHRITKKTFFSPESKLKKYNSTTITKISETFKALKSPLVFSLI